jgi:hypothetical protein
VRREQVNRGAEGRPLTLAEIEAKFFANAELAVPASQASQLRDAVFGLDRATDLAPLCAALART